MSIEVRFHPGTRMVIIRSSSDPDPRGLGFDLHEWDAFVMLVKGGHFDQLPIY